MRSVIYFLSGFILISISSFAQSDTLYLKSGEIVPGTISGMSKGNLSFNTSSFGTVHIPAEKIIGLESPTYFDVITRRGGKYFASFDRAAQKGYIRLLTATDTVDIPSTDLFSITRIKKTKRDRLSGLLNAGFSYTKASNALQISWGGELRYRSFRYSHHLSYSGLFSRTSSETSRRQDLTYNIDRHFNHAWFISGSASLQQNTQLGIRFRNLASLGAGNVILERKDIHLSAMAGINWNNEITLSKETQSSPEGLFNVRYNEFNVIASKVDIASNISFYPSLKDHERRRLDANIQLKLNLIGNIGITTTFQTNYDSKSPETNGPKNDYTVLVGFSYSI